MIWLSLPLAFAEDPDIRPIVGFLGLAPQGATRVAGSLMLGASRTSTDLFENASSQLGTIRTAPSPTFTFGGSGYGWTWFSAQAMVSAGGREHRQGDVTTAAPPLFWASYQAGGNVVAFITGDPDVRLGIGPAVGLHSGVQGFTEVRQDRIGGIGVSELVHFQLGGGAFAYLAGDHAALSIAAVYQPERLNVLTVGMVEGYGRYDPEILGTRTDIPVQAGKDYELMEALIETQNHLVLEDVWCGQARLVLGPLGIWYELRHVSYAAKSEAGIVAATQFHLTSHTAGVGFTVMAPQ